MPAAKDSTTQIAQLIKDLKGCTACPLMIGPVVTHRPIHSKIYLVGQAPGPREGEFGRPFAWTAGKTLFKWFDSIGVDEENFRQNVYMAAVCRCFPGKAKTGGDRVPNDAEIKNCSEWMRKEFELLQPELVIPVGKLAIEQFFGKTQLASIIGTKHRQVAFEHEFDIIPLPHPSGASTWHRMEPGKTLLGQALRLVAEEPLWKAIARKT
ncbi:MAG TPA: uracil-DNA glycosylase [Candidatus Melainabacteria bacterium]|nr:uracil-DNA glycosylase [Candidatus Melainabacteria bacterium]HIN65899.1 uracil-DNA glycosylase [Candidatus Obscuribacterales bacterium]